MDGVRRVHGEAECSPSCVHGRSRRSDGLYSHGELGLQREISVPEDHDEAHEKVVEGSVIDGVEGRTGSRMWSVDHLDGGRGGVCRYM